MLRLKMLVGAVLLVSSAPVLAGPTDIAYLGLTDGYWEVWVSQADGAAPRQITDLHADVSRVSWYPDGQHVLVNAHDGRWFRIDTADRTSEALSPPLPGIVDAVVAPDGERIAFSLSTGDSIDDNDLWLHQREGAPLRKLTQMPRLQHEPAWSPDGKHVYFLSGDGGQAHDIWRVDVASGSTEQLTVESLYHFDLAIGRDGALAFSSNRSGNYEIWLQPKGHAAAALTEHPGLDARPSWSPDQTQLIFESTREGDVALYRLDVATKAVQRVTTAGAAARAPVWNPTAIETATAENAK